MTDRKSAFDVLAAASAGMLSEHHPADLLGRLMADSMEPLAADSTAVLVVKPGGGLGLLSASSQRAAEIEMLQTQQSRGPCVDAVRSGEYVSAVGADALVERWDDVGAAIRDAGFESVQAFPMRWHGRVIGGFNVFRAHGEATASIDDEPIDTAAVGQAIADVATLVLVQVTDVPAEVIADRVRETLAARSAIEQAKGVLAYLHGIDPEAAYDELVREAASSDRSLTETALRLVREQYT